MAEKTEKDFSNNRYPKIEFDRLQMYFGYPYIIDLENAAGKIVMKMPTIGDIAMFGEKRFFTTLNIFVTNTTSYKVVLWDIGEDWNKVSDYELFLRLFCGGIDQEACNLMFQNITWSNFEIMSKTVTDTEGNPTTIPVLYSQKDDIEINEDVYQHIHQFLQSVFDIFPEEKFTKDKMLKEWWISSEKRKITRDAKKESSSSSTLLATISACVNHPGFKYNLEELKNVGVCQFYDSVKRLQVYESATACLKGMFSGFVDGSKIHADEYNYFKEI